MSDSVCRVVSPGIGLSFQDIGRPGWRRCGLPASGAMDTYSMTWANRLLGNRPNSPVLELVYQGIRLEVTRDCWFAYCGADLDGSFAPWSARRAFAGDIISFPRNRSGVYGYLAVEGGWECESWYSSCSVNARAGIGRMLEGGDCLFARDRFDRSRFSGVFERSMRASEKREFVGPLRIRVFEGPQFDRFNALECERFSSEKWLVSARSDRTGYRLEGCGISFEGAISSEPTLPGSVQITPSGQPIVTLKDGPTVGGYPKIAFIHPDDLSWFVQCGPNTEVFFEWVDY